MYRGAEVAVQRVWRADRPWSRLRGLLGRTPLRESEGLLLVPCASVHTFGMGYALDLVFLDAEERVLEWAEWVRPWRVRAHRGARQTLELAAGGLDRLRPTRGERLAWRSGYAH